MGFLLSLLPVARTARGQEPPAPPPGTVSSTAAPVPAAPTVTPSAAPTPAAPTPVAPAPVAPAPVPPTTGAAAPAEAAAPASMPVDTTKASGGFEETPFVNPYKPGEDYPQSTILGVYQAGRVDGARQGFVFRNEFRPSYASGKFNGSNVEVSVAYFLEGAMGLGYRFKLERRVGLTIEGFWGLGLLGFVTPSGLTRAEAAKLGVGPEGSNVRDWEFSSNKTALSILTIFAGPAVTLEYSLTPGFGLFARPLLEWGTGVQVLQSGTTSGPVTDPDGFLHQKTYSASSIGLQLGLMPFSLKNHVQVSVGIKSTTFKFEGLPDVDATGYFFAVGGTT